MSSEAKPTIHMNGSGIKNLTEDLETAYAAVREALEKVARAAPNMRDYYVQDKPDEAFALAVKEHTERMEKLRNIMKDYEDLGEYLATEENKRRK